MIASIAALLILQLVGTIIIRLTGLPLPGPVVGMLLLFAYLLWRGVTPRPFEATARALLQNLALLFVPAGVGLMVHFALIGRDLLPILVTLVVSTGLTLAATAWALDRLNRRRGGQGR